jgi:hypothetical protein
VVSLNEGEVGGGDGSSGFELKSVGLRFRCGSGVWGLGSRDPRGIGLRG